MDRSSSVAEAVAVQGGRILARGHPGGRDPQGRPRLGHVRPRFDQSQPPGLDQAVYVREAIRMCPIEGAWLERKEGLKGSIEKGKLADAGNVSKIG
ncbi:MAG TPA: hypothetical protein PLT35_01500 [Vicinamibacterales bacterium]|nr:hypothetical protein [Vicinamibacterales bacterium]HOQ59807.1 hypothetical protein [Vicinamibacterales bacterium]